MFVLKNSCLERRLAIVCDKARMLESAQRLNWRLVRKGPEVQIRMAEFWMGSRRVSWEVGARPYLDEDP